MPQQRSLARFRADPQKVRVAVQAVGTNWVATVSSRLNNKTFSGWSEHPTLAVLTALERAEGSIEGIDLGMDRAYDHPWGTGLSVPCKRTADSSEK